ncbi:ABC transporter ATP-binding protein [Occultella glacieicola]|uniref:ABC transporter ATP-binding protein n=1 Tax=Occultella glacieicola TaxID=2518684 RepID=A0ABY2DWN8_9MICO|nr:ABC transporter ATP-binding protein [Occultella glacieicola]TDE88273.1 ABC transporter ATP-binding protein [Occultella glacieicola]
MSGYAVSVRDLTVRYGRTTAVDRVSFDLEADGIYGLLGRNGSGKTSTLSVLASLRRATAGTVLVDGADPFENEALMAGIALIRESGDVLANAKISVNFDYFRRVRPAWDPDFAEELVDVFGLNRKKPISTFSRGQKSAFGAVIGLASRAPLTMFDEVYLGMDAPSRYRFYDLLLADYAEHPRTIILSSHLISEIERLFSGVVVIDEGRLLLSEDVDEFRTRGATFTGPVAAVDAVTAGLRVVASRSLGPTKEVTVYGDLDETTLAGARSADIAIGGVSVQDLFVHLTEKESR